MNWLPLAQELARGGPAAIILLLLVGFTSILGALLTGKVRLPRELEREVEARKLAEAERDQAREEADRLREQRNEDRDQKVHSLELLNTALSTRHQGRGSARD